LSNPGIVVVNLLILYTGLLTVDIVVAMQKHVSNRVFVILCAIVLPHIVYLYLLATPDRSRSSTESVRAGSSS